MNKYKIAMQSGKDHIVELKESIIELHRAINRDPSIFTEDSIIRCKYIESVREL